MKLLTTRPSSTSIRGPPSVEDAGNADFAAMHALIVEAEGFGDALTLVVTGANTDWIHATVITLRVEDGLWIPINLAGGGQQEARLHATGQAKHVVSAEKTSFRGFDKIGLVMNQGSGTSEMPNAINLELDRFGDVVADKLKRGWSNHWWTLALRPVKVLSRRKPHRTASIGRPDGNRPAPPVTRLRIGPAGIGLRRMN